MPRTKYLSVKHPAANKLWGLPSFSASGSITGMEKQYYGKNALLVRSGQYVYNVTSCPHLWDIAH